MSTTRTSARHGAHTTDGGQAAEAAAGAADQTGMTEIARQQLSMAVDATSVLYRATEAVQQIQHQMTQRAALRYQQMADKLRAATSPAEVFAIQSSLFTSGMQEATQYLQDLAAASMKMQGDIMRRGTDQSTQAAAPAAFAVNPMLQAWQTMFTAPLNGAGGSH
jgi:hypothetical protein